MLRIDPALHLSLRRMADEAGLSLNRYCAHRLALPDPGLHWAAAEAVRRAEAMLADSLAGVVVFGSWTRGEDSPESDVDLLVVVDERTLISRDLYRRWDAGPTLEWEGRRVEPHFVHVPPPEEAASGLWAEVALDGLVLYERRLALSRRLAETRRRIVAGALSRRFVHGQPYWVRRT